MLTLKNNTLTFEFPEIHADARLSISFQRTLRIPDDGRTYPLPPSLGEFPVRLVDDFKEKVPREWVKHGGVLLPMWQSEAMWIQFISHYSVAYNCAWPFAIKVSTGKRSAITGKPWSKTLREGDYCVSPEQLWLDGYVVENGIIRQFIAAPLGSGVTAEEQLTGKAEFGGLQIEVFPMLKEKLGERQASRRILRTQNLCHAQNLSFEEWSYAPQRMELSEEPNLYHDCRSVCCIDPSANSSTVSLNSSTVSLNSSTVSLNSSDSPFKRETKTKHLDCAIRPDMGLAPGGQMVQQVFKDPHDLSCWSKDQHDRCFIHLSNSMAWKVITGQDVPTLPLSAADYSTLNMPWFEMYADKPSMAGTQQTKKLKSVVAMDQENKDKPPVVLSNESATILKYQVKTIRNGQWG